ncbi:hypothetical protein XELAEV_18024494mg [Xenopus laevis]|uniref:Centriolar satellite-associated tubulin polyglutamylase complex regulator 1 n=1 Tax=Xenopus laevis TaxID=8355 RepID=A0A974D0K0_XENLA|nr:hypothetical protein XELAEV_18024494mg [Xenopus laevis]
MDLALLTMPRQVGVRSASARSIGIVLMDDAMDCLMSFSDFLYAFQIQFYSSGALPDKADLLVDEVLDKELDRLPPYANLSQWSEEDYQWFIKEYCTQPKQCIEKVFTTMVLDVRATCPKYEVAEKAAGALSGPIYRYVITYIPSAPVKPNDFFPYLSWFAFHMLDTLGFLWHSGLGLGSKYRVCPCFPEAGKMPDNCPEYPNKTTLQSTKLSAESDYHSNQSMFQYAWINKERTTWTSHQNYTDALVFGFNYFFFLGL